MSCGGALTSCPLVPWRCRADQGRLLDYVVSWGNLTEEKAAGYLRDILEALHYLHNSRIVHLDVKVSRSKRLRVAVGLTRPHYRTAAAAPTPASVRTDAAGIGLH